MNTQMEYQQATFFKEHEQDDVKGFTVLNTNDDHDTYHIGEKWLKSDGPDVWMDYHIQESDLLERVEADHCEPVGHLTDEQFEAVCDEVGWDYTPTGGVEA